MIPGGSRRRSRLRRCARLADRATAFQLQARSATMEFDLFTETADESVWCFRREGRIRRPLAKVCMPSRSGLPIVRPELQLLYMAGSTESKNLHDFEVARPTLDDDARLWLAGALTSPCLNIRGSSTCNSGPPQCTPARRNGALHPGRYRAPFDRVPTGYGGASRRAIRLGRGAETSGSPRGRSSVRGASATPMIAYGRRLRAREPGPRPSAGS